MTTASALSNLTDLHCNVRFRVSFALNRTDSRRPNSGRPMTLPGKLLECQLLSVADMQPPRTQ